MIKSFVEYITEKLNLEQEDDLDIINNTNIHDVLKTLNQNYTLAELPPQYDLSKWSDGLYYDGQYNRWVYKNSGTFITESKYTSKKTYKKGDIVETSKGVKYYVNGVPPELEEVWKRTKEGQESEFAKRKINIVYSKYFTEDSDVAAESRSWFDDKKQPSEQQVRNAMIWGYDQYGDYQIKAGGGTRSDNIFISHFRTTIADSNGNDKDVVVLKKFSTNFKDVLIYIDEIQELQNLTETQEVRTVRRKDNLRGILSVLIRHEGGFPVTDDKKLAPQKWIDDLYNDLKEEYTRDEILDYLNHIEKTVKDDMGREYLVWDQIKNDYVPKKEFKSEERKLKSIEKVRTKI